MVLAQRTVIRVFVHNDAGTIALLQDLQVVFYGAVEDGGTSSGDSQQRRREMYRL